MDVSEHRILRDAKPRQLLCQEFQSVFVCFPLVESNLPESVPALLDGSLLVSCRDHNKQYSLDVESRYGVLEVHLSDLRVGLLALRSEALQDWLQSRWLASLLLQSSLLLSRSLR